MTYFPFPPRFRGRAIHPLGWIGCPENSIKNDLMGLSYSRPMLSFSKVWRKSILAELPISTNIVLILNWPSPWRPLKSHHGGNSLMLHLLQWIWLGHPTIWQICLVFPQCWHPWGLLFVADAIEHSFHSSALLLHPSHRSPIGSFGFWL